jgi:hypothetical protein
MSIIGRCGVLCIQKGFSWLLRILSLHNSVCSKLTPLGKQMDVHFYRFFFFFGHHTLYGVYYGV